MLFEVVFYRLLTEKSNKIGNMYSSEFANEMEDWCIISLGWRRRSLPQFPTDMNQARVISCSKSQSLSRSLCLPSKIASWRSRQRVWFRIVSVLCGRFETSMYRAAFASPVSVNEEMLCSMIARRSPISSGSLLLMMVVLNPRRHLSSMDSAFRRLRETWRWNTSTRLNMGQLVGVVDFQSGQQG